MERRKMFKKILFKFLPIFFITFWFSPSFSQDINLIKNNFIIFLEKEFLANNVLTSNNPDRYSFNISDINDSKYFVTFDLLNKYISQDWFLVPTLKIVSQLDNKTYAFSRSLAFEKKSNILEIESISKMLVNSSLEQMKINGISFIVSDKQYIDKKEKKIVVSINYFNSCESSKIIEVMEKEFPGFIHMETQGFNSPSKTQLAYFTSSTKYKIKKWLDLTINDFGFKSDDFFIKIYQSKIDINKINRSKFFYICE
jgi:hypothetical protein